MNWLLIGTAMASLSMTVPTQEDLGDLARKIHERVTAVPCLHYDSGA